MSEKASLTVEVPNKIDKRASMRNQESDLRKNAKPFVIHIRENKRLQQINTDKAWPIFDPIPRDYTVAGVINGTKMSLGYAVCSKADNFDKLKARLIAVKRAVQKPYKIIDIDETPGKTFAKNAFQLLSEKPELFEKELGVSEDVKKRLQEREEREKN